MWNMTPLGIAYRAFNSGGARGTIEKMLTSTLLNSVQKGTIMGGESMRTGLEHFEPFGLTSAIVSKNKLGVAESIMNFISGGRGHSIASVIADRRYRFLGLQEGETAQHDDIGQTTIMRRTGAYVVSLNGVGNSSTDVPGADNDKRMASLRHVVKQKQPRTPMSIPGSAPSSTTASQAPQDAQNFKHEGETINTEIRCTAQHVQICDGNNAIAVYDKSAGTWTFYAKGDFTVHAKGKANIFAQGEIEIDSQTLLKFNGGGTVVAPFSVSPGGTAPSSPPQAVTD